MSDPYLDLAVRHGLLTPAQREQWGARDLPFAGESLLQALRQEGLLDSAELELLRRLSGAPTATTDGVRISGEPQLATDGLPMAPHAAETRLAPANPERRAVPVETGPTPSHVARMPVAPPATGFPASAEAPPPTVVLPAPSPIAPSPSDPSAPRRIGRYRILDVLGRGGMGVVYRAEDPVLARPVALKALDGGAFVCVESVNRFQREARMAARLTHPNIVRVHEVGTDGATHYYTMDLVTGENFEEWLERRRGTPRKAVEILVQVAEALHYAHRSGVVHRDLKPGNILIDAEGRPYLTDFGLGRELDVHSPLTLSGMVLGTPAYMPPEQAAGRVREIDERSDVYALGAVIYHALTGVPPFSGASIADILRDVAEREPVPARKRDPALPSDLEVIVFKCLEKDKSRRYADARELADDLRRFLAGEPIRARTPSRAYRVRRWIGRNRRLSGALALGAGIFLVLAVRVLGPSRVLVTTDPPGAEVTWDGEPLGDGWVWPWSGAGMIVPTRRFPLRVSAEGYEPAELSVELSSFTVRDLGTIRLVPERAWLSVNTAPSGAEVWLDGAALGARTPISRHTVGHGLHRLRLALPGHVPLELPVRAAPGEVFDLGTVPLAPAEGD